MLQSILRKQLAAKVWPHKLVTFVEVDAAQTAIKPFRAQLFPTERKDSRNIFGHVLPLALYEPQS